MVTWRQCERLVEEGKVRYIGMSNMTIPKLEAVLPLCRIKPAALEMELHPGFQQPELFDYAKAHGILPVGYCPIGSPSRPERDRTAEDIADTHMPEIVEIAKRHNVHPVSYTHLDVYKRQVLRFCSSSKISIISTPAFWVSWPNQKGVFSKVESNSSSPVEKEETFFRFFSVFR